MKDIIQLRKEIDKIDEKILELLSERVKLVRKIAKEKHKVGLPFSDGGREKQLKEMWKEKTMELGLLAKPISQILNKILNMSKKEQRRVKLKHV